jgi:hypothetical protein
MSPESCALILRKSPLKPTAGLNGALVLLI